MSKRIYAIILVILVAVFLLTACERPASIAPVTTPTTSGEIPFPVATQPQIMKDILSATQTSAAVQGTITTGNIVVVITNTPAFTYSTPTPAALVTVSSSVATSTPTVVSATATPTKTAYPTATPGKPGTYTIQAGEFPYCIARRFNVDPAELLSINGLNTSSRVSIGTNLTIPQDGNWPGTRALKSHPTSYTVAYGDSLGSIACGFGDVDPNTILAANGLSAGTILSQGQVLQIP